MSDGKQHIFTSWKEISSYLGRGVRTVQRWEHELGLPVQRPDAKAKGTVRADKTELDDWAARTWSQRSSKQDTTMLQANERLVVRQNIATSRQLRLERREVLEQMHAAIHELAESCRQLKESREVVHRWKAAKAGVGGGNTND